MTRFLPAVLNTIKASRDTIAELADVAMEALDSSKVLNDVPVVSLAVKVLNVKDAFAQARLKRNCMAFMTAVAEGNTRSLQQLAEKLEANREFADDFSDTLIALLLEAQKPIKCEIVGRLVLALAQCELTEQEFAKLAEIIQACTVPALKALPVFFGKTAGKPFLSGAGEVAEEPSLLSLGIACRFGTMFRIDISGQNLYRHGFGGTVENMQ
jgi:hypothetical protein